MSKKLVTQSLEEYEAQLQMTDPQPWQSHDICVSFGGGGTDVVSTVADYCFGQISADTILEYIEVLKAEVERLKAEVSIHKLPTEAQWKELTPQQRFLVGETLLQAIIIMLQSFKAEDIERLPGHCKHVMPNLLGKFQRDAEWFRNAAKGAGMTEVYATCKDVPPCDYQGHEFGASYPDSVCIDGHLWDADSENGDGNLTKGGDIPCPKCQPEAHAIYYQDEDEEEND